MNNFSITDIENYKVKKKKSNHSLPLFALFRELKRKDGSKIVAHLYVPTVIDTAEYFSCFVDSRNVLNQSDIFNELLCRFIRKHKILAAFSDVLRHQFKSRYSLHHKINFGIDENFKYNNCGFLEVHEHGLIKGTGLNIENVKFYDSVNKAACFRNEQLEKLKKSKVQPTGALLVQWILQTELSKLIQVKQNESKPSLTEIRSNAAKQTWLRRQQSCSANV